MTENKKLTLEDILENPIEEIVVPDICTVKVRCPTNKDKMAAKKEAKALCNGLTEQEELYEYSKLLALKMIQEPKLSMEDYMNANDSKLSIILDTIDMWYTLKLKSLNDKRSTLIKDFLEQMKELNQ